jgi:hypothetical protein
MIQSERETVTDDYPEVVKTAMYRALKPVKIRDFPSMQGKITGYLDKGDLIQGRDIEGIWLHVFENEYISLNFLERIKDEKQLKGTDK